MRLHLDGSGEGREKMAGRIHNFNAGPAALPLSVLEQVKDELLDFKVPACP